MTSCPTLLNIPGKDSHLLVPPEDDFKVRLMLQGMNVAYRREAVPGSFVNYVFPGMGEAEIQGIIRMIARETPITQL